jgi:hypothetical protein
VGRLHLNEPAELPIVEGDEVAEAEAASGTNDDPILILQLASDLPLALDPRAHAWPLPLQ